MWFKLKCRHCHTVYDRRGREDGPGHCFVITDPKGDSCPLCGGDDYENLDYYPIEVE